MKINLYFKSVALLGMLAFLSCSKDKQSGQTAIQNDGPVTLKSGIVVEKKGTQYFWERDILLSKEQFNNLDKYGQLLAKKPDYIGPERNMHPVYNVPFVNTAQGRTIPRAFSIYPTAYNMWAMVRIIYGSNLTTPQKQKVYSALLEMQSSTNVRFYNATCEPLIDPTYGFAYPNIEFWSVGAADVSDSQLGRQGGVQRINLADFAFSAWDNSVIIHEICHALGLRHEHTRLDRDTYVTLNTSNLTSSGLAQFSIPSTNYYQTGAYDYTSVMGYSSYTTSTSIVNNTSLPMYTRKDGSSIYQGSYLSNSDRSWINNFYIPYIARSDVYAELAPTVYKADNSIMTAQERLNLQAQLNNGNPTPPACCQLTNDLGKFTCP
ncbi:M12 family metallopeptidase [Chitinophaga sp. 212800010-3]|uniref:M12 family metallopeptidase n=1 Tax=unclassified Chitinophaga TaxID=2619133 RepID=UPI002DF30DCD|nr:Peptidase M12A domain-containing protein [Chitinophaga sp. 212800010-3]